MPFGYKNKQKTMPFGNAKDEGINANPRSSKVCKEQAAV